jgi:hypothetical protein
MSEHTQSKRGIGADCAAFQEKLPQLFGSATDFSKEEHLRTCENCAELVRDLEYIAQQAKLLMPIHDPSPAVWSNIKSALDTPETSTK